MRESKKNLRLAKLGDLVFQISQKSDDEKARAQQNWIDGGPHQNHRHGRGDGEGVSNF